MAVSGIEQSQLLAQLKTRANAFELYEVTTFKGYRRNEKGEDKEVTIEVYDAGPDAGTARYTVIATDEDGRAATGIPTDSLSTTINNVHWSDLDRDG